MTDHCFRRVVIVQGRHAHPVGIVTGHIVLGGAIAQDPNVIMEVTVKDHTVTVGGRVGGCFAISAVIVSVPFVIMAVDVGHWDAPQAIVLARNVLLLETIMTTTMMMVGKRKIVNLFILIKVLADFTDSNDPNSVDSSSEECTTSTFSSCRTLCLAGSTTTCTSSSTTCSDVIGCDTSGTSWASTITPAPAVIMGVSDTWATVTDDSAYDISAAVSVISFLSGIGDFGSMTTNPVTTPAPTTSFITCSHYDEDPDEGVTSAYCVCSSSTFSETVDTSVDPANSCAYTTLPSQTIPPPVQTIVTTVSSICSVCTFVGTDGTCTSIADCSTAGQTATTPPYPTNTAENVGSAYCFSSSDGNYVQFTETDAQDVISSFCSQNYVLEPDNPTGFAEGYEQDGYTVVAAASWAADQTGCGTEADFPFNANSDECLEGWSTDFYCVDEDSSASTSYGGAYVLEPPGNVGCILISLNAYSTSSSKRASWLTGPGTNLDPVVYNSTADQLNGTALQQSATAPHIWSASNNTLLAHKSRLFNQSMLALLTNGTAIH